jgi:hypothetical protein
MSPTCWLPPGAVPAGGGVRQPAVAAGLSPYAVLGDGRLAVAYGTGETRLGVLDPDQRPPDRPGPALPGIRLRRVRGRPDHRHHRGRTGRADDRDRRGGLRTRRERAGPRAEPQRRLAAGSGLPAGAAGGPADRSFGFGRARDRLPAGQPRVRGPEGERPPYIVWVHGGPPRRSSPGWTWRRPSSPAAASGSST